MPCATGEGRGAYAPTAGCSVRPERRPFLALRPLQAQPLPEPIWRTSSAGCPSAIWWTGERRDLVYWRDGTYDRHALDAYSYLFRDRRNGEVEPIFYGVLDQLFLSLEGAGPAGVDRSRLRLPLEQNQRMAPRELRRRRPQLVAYDRHGGGHQGARPRRRGGVARGRGHETGRRRPLPGIRLRPPRCGSRAKLGLWGTGTAPRGGIWGGTASARASPSVAPAGFRRGRASA